MSIYIGNDLEDRLEALEMEKTSLTKYNLEDRLKALETENALLKKYNEYHKVVHEIDHMSDLHLDSSFHKQSMKLDNYVKIEEQFDFSIGQSKNWIKRDLRYRIKTKCKIREGTLTLKMAHISFVALTSIIQRRPFVLPSEAFLFLNGIIGNSNGETYDKQIAFYKTHSGLGLSISTAYNGSHVTVANDSSTLISLDYRFPTQK